MMAMKKGFEPLRSAYRDAKEEAYMPHGRFTHTLANEAMSQAVERGDEVVSPRELGFLENHGMELAKLRAEAGVLASRIQLMADRMFGTEPENCEAAGTSPPPDCHTNELMSVGAGIGAALWRCRYQMDRLEKL